MTLKVGDVAPLFSLKDTDKNLVSLVDYKGKNVVLLFFPAAFTGTCTKELCQTRDELSMYNNLNAVVLGISVDSFFSLAKFKELNNYNFTLLSDFNKETATAYDCIYSEWIHGLKGVAKRSSFVVDKEGIIRFTQVLESANDYPDFEGIKTALTALN